MAYSPYRQQPQSDAQPAETRLLNRLGRMGDGPGASVAVVFHLSNLQAYFRKPYHAAVAERCFDALVKTGNAETFRLAGGDIVLVAWDIADTEIEVAIGQIRALFAGDPLVGGAGDPARFHSWFDLARNGEQIIDDVQRRIRQGRRAPGRETAAPARTPMAAAKLDSVCEHLRRLDIGGFIETQTAIHIGGAGLGKLLFREHFVAMAPDHDLTANRWLFQYLTESLDKQVLALIGAQRFDRLRHPISLNLNASTVVGRDFRAFDERVGVHTDKVIIELQFVDAMADGWGFAKARDRLRRRGYKVAIDGMTPLLLTHFNPLHLDPDYFKVYWGVEYTDRLAKNARIDAKSVLARLGREKIIMTRVDSEDGVAFGLSMGIVNFQGRFMDRLLDALAQKTVRRGADRKEAT